MIGINLQLFDGSTSQDNLTDIQAMWWDVTEPKDGSKPVGKSDAVTTSATGYINLDLSKVTSLSIGDEGFLMLYKLDAADHEDSLVFAGQVVTSDIASGVDMYYYDSGWTRPADWPAISSPVNGTQKIEGLFAVYDIETGGNACAFTCAGAYTVDWGDGSASEDFATGVQAEHTFDYDDADFTSSMIAGRSSTEAVTFTDTGNLVNLTAHGFSDGQLINFASITTTTGISTYTRYYIINSTANSFQIATAKDSTTVVALTTDGSGSLFVPEFKLTTITITPQSGQNLTSIDFNKRHSNFTSGQDIMCPWKDIMINGASLTSIIVGGGDVKTCVEQCHIGQHSVTTTSYMFGSCYSLQSVPLFDLSSVTTTSYMFGNCYALQSVPLFDLSSVTDASSMFRYCYSLQSVPLFDLSSVTNASHMFRYCHSLQSVPLFDLSSVTTTSYMFGNCYALQSVPLFDLSSVTDASYMFGSCYALRQAATTGLSVSIDFTNCNIGPNELNRIYSNLGATTGATITVTGNWGTASDNPALVPTNWTVTG